MEIRDFEREREREREGVGVCVDGWNKFFVNPDSDEATTLFSVFFSFSLLSESAVEMYDW